MKVLFIYPDIIGDIDYTGTYYTGIGSLSSELRKFGHTTALIHITQDVDREKLISEVFHHSAL